MLGYVGEITPTELKAMKRRGYQLGDIVGQAGVEATYDSYLRGRDGSAQLTVDSRGRPTSPIEPLTSPRTGNTLRLTIDIDLQRAAEHALRDGIALAHQTAAWAADGGAIVALDPRDGSVLALASYPTYEPSVYVSRDPRKLAPLQNDAVAAEKQLPGPRPRARRHLSAGLDVEARHGARGDAGAHPHAVLVAALLARLHGRTGRIVHELGPVRRTSWIDAADGARRVVRHLLLPSGSTTSTSCRASRGHPLQNWASRFGFGAPTGIDVGPEASGLVPTPEWREQTFAGPQYSEIDRTWKPGYSIQMAIGQGDLAVTPIQMARFYAMIANGGQLVTPHIAEDVEQPTGDPKAPQVAAPLQPRSRRPRAASTRPRSRSSATASSRRRTRRSARRTGVFGTFPIPIAGKTGTAEKLSRCRATRRRASSTSRGGAATGPSDERRRSSCAP